MINCRDKTRDAHCTILQDDMNRSCDWDETIQDFKISFLKDWQDKCQWEEN